MKPNTISLACKTRPVAIYEMEIDGAGVFQKIESGREGIFHGWGEDFEEFESGPGNFTVAIIELEDGSVETFVPKMIRFLDVLQIPDPNEADPNEMVDVFPDRNLSEDYLRRVEDAFKSTRGGRFEGRLRTFDLVTSYRVERRDLEWWKCFLTTPEKPGTPEDPDGKDRTENVT